MAWLRPEDCQYVTKIDVGSGMNGDKTSSMTVQRALPDLGPKGKELQKLELKWSGSIAARATSAEWWFRVDDMGQWRVVRGNPCVWYD